MSSGGGNPAVLPVGCGQRPSPAAGSPESVPANRGCPRREPARCSASVPLSGPVGLLCCKAVVLTPRYQPGGKLLVGEVTLRVLGCAVCAQGDPGLQSQGRRGKQHPPCASSLNKILAGDPFQLLPHPCLLRPAPRPRTGLWKPLCQSPLPGRAAEGCFFFFPFPRRDDNSHTSKAF